MSLRVLSFDLLTLPQNGAGAAVVSKAKTVTPKKTLA